MRDAVAEAAQERREQKIGQLVERLAEGVGLGSLAQATLTGLTVRMPTEVDPGVLLVVRASSPTGKWVAFVGAFTLADALLAWAARLRASREKWREDVPWGGDPPAS